ncbi:MAG TPA: DUF3618 domain-containing protein [Actinomycetota bacterium]|nr:DUF3618 domain-containing protein [Actinomycetota bacterium]
MSIVALGALWAPPAQAATCQSVPGSTTGLDLSVAGQQRRVPAISGITVCVDSPVIPLVTVSTSGNGNCTVGCLSVLSSGGDFDTGAVTLSYREDGSTRSQTVSGGSLGGPDGSCLLSVGAPDAPYPTCFVALGIDDLPVDPDEIQEDLDQLQEDLGQDVDELQEDLEDLQGDLGDQVDQLEEDLGNLEQTACDTIPPLQDPNSWEEYRFCDDPAAWAGVITEGVLLFIRDTVRPIQDLIRDRPTPQEIAEIVCDALLEPSC